MTMREFEDEDTILQKQRQKDELVLEMPRVNLPRKPIGGQIDTVTSKKLQLEGNKYTFQSKFPVNMGLSENVIEPSLMGQNYILPKEPPIVIVDQKAEN